MGGFLKSIPEFHNMNCKALYNGTEPNSNQVFELNYDFVTKLVFKESKNRLILAEKLLDSLTSDPTSAWQQMQSIMSDENTQANVLRDMVHGKNKPPWDLVQGFGTLIERELRPMPNGECRVLNNPKGEPKLFCKADVGDACQWEIDAKRAVFRPKLHLVEDSIAAQKAKVYAIRTADKWRGLNTSSEHQAALKTLDNLRKFRKTQCCIAT